MAARSPIGLITKSTLIRRDRHLLQDLARAAGVNVTVSIPITDPHLARRIEPGVPPPAERFRVVRELADLNLDVGVNMAPVLPGLTDSDAAIAELMGLAREHGARRVGVRMLHLKPEPKRWFLHNLRRYFPHLEPIYADLYATPNPYVDDSVEDDLEARAGALRDFIGPVQTDTPPLSPPPPPIQLPLASGF